ncbi:hypothetical protein J5N97_000108 [Dioscorea zingiberensis]|uniref:SHSP domain-containing protein n=1 Tax=Dioscorea zingiberensis TaxID=325984 RepID=A0A9D5BSR8_9LILI|nr:hypothetical protein J5N97_000108 [Dioscorea zingiberensis]
MKVHPIPKRRNISIQYHSRSPLSLKPRPSSASPTRSSAASPRLQPRPRAPFSAPTPTSSSRRTPTASRFVAETESFGHDVRAHTVEIHPGVTKVVVRERGSAAELTLDELELDMWRFRLPESTRPELARAVLSTGELIVTVPKMEGWRIRRAAAAAAVGMGVQRRMVLNFDSHRVRSDEYSLF